MHEKNIYHPYPDITIIVIVFLQYHYIKDSFITIPRYNDVIFTSPLVHRYIGVPLYLVSSSIKTWQQAQAYCHAVKAQLVKINSVEENEFVLSLVKQCAPSLKQVWIGHMWDSSTKDFLWSDYSVPVYKNWAPGEPNGKGREPCAHMWTGQTTHMPHWASGYWNDLPCAGHPKLPCDLVCKRQP